MSFFNVISNFSGSPFRLASTCPSGATTRLFYLNQEQAEKIAEVLNECLDGETWKPEPVSD